MLRTLLVLVLLLPALARAATVAVLPLTKGAGSEHYDGLGDALAGMLVADLATADGLVLVERERLDDLLDEIRLADAGFVDPSTAQRLGQGLGAEMVVTGSYSVVGDAFVMDVRLVSVATSEVVRAAAGDGPVSAFVSVEKDVVEGLLDGLDAELGAAARRRLLLQAPTESFDAFAAYGEGRARVDAGDDEAARAAFERALVSDPEFAAARSELAALKARLEAMRAEDDRRDLSERDQALRRTLAEAVDERDRPADHHDNLDELALFGLRLAALQEVGLHCQRAEELTHYLYRVQGQVGLPEGHDGSDLTIALSEHAWRLGLAERRKGDTYTRDRRVRGAADPLTSPKGLMLDLDAARPGHDMSASLFHSISRCEPEERWAPTYERIREHLRGWGVAGRSYDRYHPDRPLDDELEAFLLVIRARTGGVTPQVEARMQAFLDAYEGGDDRSWATGVGEQVVTEGENHDRHVFVRRGMPEDALAGVGHAVANIDPGLVSTESTFCATVVPLVQPSVADAMDSWQEDRWGTKYLYAPFTLDRVALEVAPLLDMGCIAGVPARFGDADEALDWIASSPERARADKLDEDKCAELWSRWTGGGTRALIAATRDPVQQQTYLYGALSAYYNGPVLAQCVEEP